MTEWWKQERESEKHYKGEGRRERVQDSREGQGCCWLILSGLCICVPCLDDQTLDSDPGRPDLSVSVPGYYIIPSLTLWPDILYLLSLRGPHSSHLAVSRITGHGHCPLVCPGPAWLLLLVKVVFPSSQECVHMRHRLLYTCTHVICHGKLSLLSLEQHRCECVLLMIISIEIMLMSNT